MVNHTAVAAELADSNGDNHSGGGGHGGHGASNADSVRPKLDTKSIETIKW
jgi:hypothetical protein